MFQPPFKMEDKFVAELHVKYTLRKKLARQTGTIYKWVMYTRIFYHENLSLECFGCPRHVCEDMVNVC